MYQIFCFVHMCLSALSRNAYTYYIICNQELILNITLINMINLFKIYMKSCNNGTLAIICYTVYIRKIVLVIRIFSVRPNRRISRFLNFFIACKSAEKCPGSSPSHSAYLQPCWSSSFIYLAIHVTSSVSSAVFQDEE